MLTLWLLGMEQVRDYHLPAYIIYPDFSVYSTSSSQITDWTDLKLLDLVVVLMNRAPVRAKEGERGVKLSKLELKNIFAKC